jgi:hypothetical protein
MEELAVEDLVDGFMEAEMMIKIIRMRQEVLVRTKGEIIPTISMIKIIEIREEKEEGKDLEEEASMGSFFTIEKKGIENLSFPSAKEG